MTATQNVTLTKTGPQQYTVSRDGQTLGTVRWYDGDRQWKYRVGGRAYRGHGWHYDLAHRPVGYRHVWMVYPTRRKAIEELLADVDVMPKAWDA